MRSNKDNKNAKQVNLITTLNPIIKGWGNYHKSVIAKETFMRVDHEIWKSLWQWAKRRHPGKNAAWIKKKYFKTVVCRNWVFAAEVKEKHYPDGKPLMVKLFQTSDIPIKRHIKIRGEANPFDLQFETYFEDRTISKMRANLRGSKRLLGLWLSQNGSCPICGQKITDTMQWRIHYGTRKVEGGSDNILNLSLMHDDCHRRLHASDLDDVEPAAKRRA